MLGNTHVCSDHSKCSEEKSINLPHELEEDTLVQNLRFGDGPKLREGEGDTSIEGQESLKGRHIIRVGWDDVRGWMGEVRSLILKHDLYARN